MGGFDARDDIKVLEHKTLIISVVACGSGWEVDDAHAFHTQFDEIELPSARSGQRGPDPGNNIVRAAPPPAAGGDVAVPHDGLAGAQEHDDAPRMRWVLVGEEAPPEHAQAMVLLYAGQGKLVAIARVPEVGRGRGVGLRGHHDEHPALRGVPVQRGGGE